MNLQDWVVASSEKVLILFEGRDAAGYFQRYVSQLPAAGGIVLPYEETPKAPIVLPQREHHEHYSRQAVPAEMLVPEVY